MKNNVLAAAILALGLMIAAFVASGRYSFVSIGQCAVATGDRWTGKVETFVSSSCSFEKSFSS